MTPDTSPMILEAPSTTPTEWYQAFSRTKRVQDTDGNWHGFSPQQESRND